MRTILTIKILFVFGLLLISNSITASPGPIKCDDAFISILTIDGGKQSGIIPIKILQKIEQETQLPIATSFDFMGASSFGSLTIALLTMPNKIGNAPLYSIDEVIRLYLQYLETVFFTTTWREIKSAWGFFSPQYSSSTKKRLTELYFNNTKMDQLLSHVILFALNFTTQHVILFSNWNNSREYSDLNVKDIIDGSTAITGLFKPRSIKQGNQTIMTLLDVAIALNNSTTEVFLTTQAACPNTKHFVILSLGTDNYSNSDFKTMDWGIYKWVSASKWQHDAPARRMDLIGESLMNTAYMIYLTQNFNNINKNKNDNLPYILFIRIQPDFRVSKNLQIFQQSRLDYYKTLANSVIKKNEHLLQCISQLLKTRDYKALSPECLNLFTQQKMTEVPENLKMLGFDFLTRQSTGIIYTN